MSKTQNRTIRKADPKEPQPSTRTHVKIFLTGKDTIWFPRQLVDTSGSIRIDLKDVKNWCLTAPGEIVPFLTAFLGRLSRIAETQADLIKFVDGLPKEGIEACINLMLEIKYRFPVDRACPGIKIETEWPEYLFQSIPLCTDAIVLEKLCRSYPWYIGASRRVVTLQHVSKKGLNKAFLRALGDITVKDPSLAFALAPTTLHENTLVAPAIAKFFTCDPLASRKLDVVTNYLPVIEEKECKGLEMGKRNVFEEKPGPEVAAGRVRDVIAFLRDDKGEFPWHHPERPDTGIILAGGFPCAALLCKEKYDQILPKTDLDFFVYSPTDEGQREMAEIILRHVEKLGGKLQQVIMGSTEADASKILKTACVYRVDGLEREVQIIFPFAFSPLGVLINFDSTFIQVGYQEHAMICSTVRSGDEAPIVKKSFIPSFMATPGYCFFTPRSESLITRYNIRYYRLMKLLARGFIPVSDERGHLLYPNKIFFSSRWRMALQGQAYRDENWIRVNAIRRYIITKKIERARLEEVIGDLAMTPEWIKESTVRSLAVQTTENRETVEKELGAEKLKENEEKALLTLPDSFFEDKDAFEMEMITAKVSAATFNENPSSHWITIHGPNGVAKDENDQEKKHCWGAKPQVTWVDLKADEALANFNPQGATLSNGFDIYTAGVNNTLPIPSDGETDNLYEFNVLLRNVEILEPKSTYNLAAPEDKPLKVSFTAFPDERNKYKADVYQGCGKEPVRTIEGVFLFADNKTEEEIEADYIAYEKRRLANLENFQRKADLKARVRADREAKSIKAKQELLAKAEEARKAKGIKVPVHQSRYERKLQEREEKLKRKEENRINEQNEKRAAQKEAALKALAVVNGKEEVSKGKEEMSEGSEDESDEKSVEKVAQEKMAEKEEAPKKARDPRQVKMASLVTHIDFRDLHRYVAVPKEAAWIPVEELPWLIKEFAEGKKEYKAKSGIIVKRADGMVKIRATVTFNPCMIFDVDDLFLPQRSLDTHSKRRYNAVVKLANLSRWIVKAHEHQGVLTTASSRQMIMAALQEELKDAEKKDGSKTYMPVTEFLRAIRHVANEAEFEEAANKLSCTKPHAAKGLPGEMPVLFCSRLYVTRHE